jgi:hypothetical protein
MYNNTTPNFNLKKFNLADIADHAAICMVSKRHSGKSFLVREILAYKRNINTVVIAPTDKMSGFYDEFVPSSFIHYEYSSELLSKIFMRQSAIIEKSKERVKKGKPALDTRLFLIMDDCLASKSIWMKDQNILELLQNGRHFHITFILTMQYSLGICPELRSNFDYVFLLGEDFISNQKRLFEHYAGMFPSFDIFKRVFIKVTENYGTMVINNRKKSANISEKVFWYKASDPGKFTLGGKQYTTFHKNFYNPDWKKKIKVFDVDEYLNKKQKINIDVCLNK